LKTPALNKLDKQLQGASIPATNLPFSDRTFHDWVAAKPNMLLPENTNPV
jgi:hypothetical protein